MPTTADMPKERREPVSRDTRRVTREIQQPKPIEHDPRRSGRSVRHKPPMKPVTRRSSSNDRLINREERAAGSSGSFQEIEHIVRIKNYLGPVRWVEFLKLLDLFVNEQVTKSELLYLARDLLNQNPTLLTWMRNFVGLDEAELSDDVHSFTPSLSSCRSRFSEALILPVRSKSAFLTEEDRTPFSIDQLLEGLRMTKLLLMMTGFRDQQAKRAAHLRTA